MCTFYGDLFKFFRKGRQCITLQKKEVMLTQGTVGLCEFNIVFYAQPAIHPTHY